MSHIEEIAARRSLLWLGAILAVLNMVAVQWWLHSGIALFLSADAEPICWPLIPGCYRLHVLSPELVHLLLRLYELTCVAVAALFIRRQTATQAYWGLVAITIGKVLFMAIDFRTRMNQHYMLLFVTVAFLFVRNKAFYCRLLIVLFYVWAGFLKFNRDWLSGASLYGPLWLIPPAYVPWAMRYAIPLELIMPWGLLARRPHWLFWGALVQLVAFHLVSAPIVGFFYPLVMLGFLLWILVARWDETTATEKSVSGPLLIALFCGLQLIPRLISSDAALTGEGRLWALHMFDGRITCASQFVWKLPTGERRPWRRLAATDARSSCDPILFWNYARNACREKPGDEFDIRVRARHLSDPEGSERPLIDIENFCRLNPDYKLFGHNDWILPKR